MAAAAALNGKLTDVRKYGILPRMPDHSRKQYSSISTNVHTGTGATGKEGDAPHSKDHQQLIREGKDPVKFVIHRGIAAPLSMENIDTDVIISVQFLADVTRSGYGKYLFHALRVSPSTGEKTDFILNHVPYDKSSIIVCTGRNFGCGSSREAAVWSLYAYQSLFSFQMIVGTNSFH